MYSIKNPTLRINQEDLQCKNGCGFYGNASWEGYCSLCYRDYTKKKREKTSLQDQQRLEQSRAQVPGFSKFEEKKRQQSDKKTKYLKNFTPVFRKSNAKDIGRPDKHPELRHTNPEIDKLTTEYITVYGHLGENVQKDFTKCVDMVYKRIYAEVNAKAIEEVAEVMQKYYTMFLDRMNSHIFYEDVNSETKDQILVFFEKFVMTALYSWLFCPQTTDDEEKDLTIQNRIRKLSWVTAHHLGCCISETSMEVRELVYTAITDLLGMDSVKAPQDKLACVVRCCRSIMEVLQHCQGGPVSADEFLPALIFIVLKGNPARLKSNIQYVTRFCNDSQLMKGEGGYYFTNLCCAVSFIENLNSESLNMSKEEFDDYMSGFIKPVSAWESALVACESMHQLCEHLSFLKSLSNQTDKIQSNTKELREEIFKFKDDIISQVSYVLNKTPLIIKARKTAIELDRQDSMSDNLPPPINPTVINQSDTNQNSCPNNETETPNYYQHNLQLQTLEVMSDKQKSSLKLEITPCLPNESDNPIGNELKTENLEEFKSPSPNALTLDCLTPDNAQDSFLGLSNVNYDIDFSDLSADNSVVDELTPEKAVSLSCTPDPFSPLGSVSRKISQPPLIPSNSSFPNDDTGKNNPFDVLESGTEKTILDKEEELTAKLPTPLQPIASQYSGFSKQGCQIPNIPCNTGDYSSLNMLIPETKYSNTHKDEEK